MNFIMISRTLSHDYIKWLLPRLWDGTWDDHAEIHVTNSAGNNRVAEAAIG